MNILIDSQTLYTPEIDRGIGYVFKETLISLINHNIKDEIFLIVEKKSDIDQFPNFFKSNIQLIIEPNINLDLKKSIKSSRENYTTYIKKICIENSIDIYLSPNPLMTNVILPMSLGNETKYSTIIYDLIPLTMRDKYESEWGKSTYKTYLDKIETLINSCDIFFHISKFTSSEFIKNTHTDNKKHFVISLSANKIFEPIPFQKSNKIDDYFIFVGGFDPRKNLTGAIDGFALFKRKYKNNIKLKIVCKTDDESVKKLNAQISDKKLTGQVELTGFITDYQLKVLYQNSLGLFFPSLYEGFGLPILESYKSGIPVAIADNSSLPEVGGDLAILFNPNDDESMALALNKLSKAGHSLIDKKKRVEYSNTFSWNKTANIIFSAFNETRKKSLKKQTDNIRIAWVSPFDPVQSGISNYSKQIIFELKKYCKVDIYYDQKNISENISRNFNCYKLDELTNKKGEYQEIFYNIGNNPIHKEIYKTSLKIPGTVIIHDLNLQPFFEHSFLRSDVKSDEKYFYDIFTKHHNFNLKKIKEKTKTGIPSDLWKYECTEELVSVSKRILVHSRWAKRKLNNTKVEVVPHFSYIPIGSKYSHNFKQELIINDSSFVISVFGFINKNKQPKTIINAIHKLRKKGFNIHFILVGEISSELTDIKQLVAENNWITSTGFANDAKYFSLMNYSDIIINLRNPSVGETSGTLMQSLAAKKQIITYDLDQYQEIISDNITFIKKDNENELMESIKNILLNDNYMKDRSKNLYELSNLIKLYQSF